MAKKIIGRCDFADFPELGLQGLAVKIDTGAYTSSIHCHHIKVKQVGEENILTFKLLDPSHRDYNGRPYSFTHFRKKGVRSSNGKVESRYFIRTKIRLFGRDYPVELSLSERGEMRYPVLLGRRLLMGRFVVDPSLSDLSRKASDNPVVLELQSPAPKLKRAAKPHAESVDVPKPKRKKSVAT